MPNLAEQVIDIEGDAGQIDQESRIRRQRQIGREGVVGAEIRALAEAVVPLPQRAGLGRADIRRVGVRRIGGPERAGRPVGMVAVAAGLVGGDAVEVRVADLRAGNRSVVKSECGRLCGNARPDGAERDHRTHD